jgi:ABC-type transport system substrate-binding protein
MFTNNRGLGDSALLSRVSAQIPNASNRWAGSNHGGWSKPEYDRLVTAFTSSLVESERQQGVAEAMRIYTEDLGGISLFFPTQAWAPVGALHGLKLVAAEASMAWDIQNWQLD